MCQATGVARIFVFEPNADVGSLLELVIDRLGHEPVVPDTADVEQAEVDAAVIEPCEGAGLELARRLRAREVPVVFASIYPSTPELLGLEPVAYLMKPFALYALERALADALRTSAAPL